MKNTLETRLGIFVAFAAIAAVLILETVGGVGRFQRGYRLHALFGNVQELKVGDRVKMAGVEIGRVEGLTLTNNKVMVTMKVQASHQGEVRTDSVATVKFVGLLGQNFVSVDFGTPGALPASDGSFLNTQEQPDMSAMMQKIEAVATGVENLTKSFTGFKVDDLLGPLTDFIRANKDPLTISISNLQVISTQVAQGHGTAGKLVFDESLYNSALSSVKNLNDTASQIKLAVADARNLLGQAESGQGTIGKLIKDDTLYRETTESLKILKEILQKANQGHGSVSKLLNDQHLYKHAMLTLQKVDKATEGLEDQGPLSVLGLILGRLF